VIKIIITLLLSINISLFAVSNGEKSVAKFLVVDNATYTRIVNSNLLNDGIYKKYLVSDARLRDEELKEFYPEYFIFTTTTKCNAINSLTLENQPSLNIQDKSMLLNEKDILSVVKKIKFLQIASEHQNEQNLTNLSKYFDKDLTKVIHSIGYLCKNKLMLRDKVYKVGDIISSKFKITKIDTFRGKLSIKKEK
jgi:hypothetical protein